MTLRRGLPLLVLALVLAAIGVSSAGAARPVPGCVFDGTMSSEHFTVHWLTDKPSQAVCANGTGYYEPQAGETLGHAENAYRVFTDSWGYPDPVDDGDGHVDIYVYIPKDPDEQPLAAVFELDTPAAPTSSGWFAVNPESATDPVVVGSGVFFVLQGAFWGVPQGAFAMAAAEWAGLAAAGFPASESLLTKPDITLDCGVKQCDETLYFASGSGRWPFFQYLQDRLGANAVRELWEQVAARANPTPDGVGALTDLLAAEGLTLTEVYNDFAAALAAGTLGAPTLKGQAPKAFAQLKAGAQLNAAATQKVSVNHLSTRFVEIVPGDGSGGLCHPATLKVEVTVPAGIGARPSFASADYGGATMAVSGTTATLTTAWDTCTWANGHRALVSLPNPSPTANGQEFTVRTTLTAVDETVIVSPDAPVEVPDDRPTVPTPDAIPPPTLSFFGAAAIPVARNGSVTVAFFASNGGSVRVSAGGKRLKTVRVKTGQNVLRLRLPLARTTSRTAAGSALARPRRLDLTAVSPTGRVGKTFSRKLRYAV